MAAGSSLNRIEEEKDSGIVPTSLLQDLEDILVYRATNTSISSCAVMSEHDFGSYLGRVEPAMCTREKSFVDHTRC